MPVWTSALKKRNARSARRSSRCAQKPLEKITVKELCAAAYINKSTFYAHYEDLFALSDTLEREAVDAILQDIGKAGTYSLDTPEAFARALCISFHAHLPTINVLFSGKAQNRLADRLETGIKAHIFAVYPAWRQDPVMQIALSYSIHGAYWAYTKNQNVDEAQLLDVIGQLAGALRALY